MKSAKRRFFSGLTALVVMLSCNAAASAQTITGSSEGDMTDNENTVILSYNEEAQKYEFVDEDGNIVLEEKDYIAESSETETTVTTQPAVTTVCEKKTAVIYIKGGQIVTSAPINQTVTTTTTLLPPGYYVGRDRDEVRSEVAAMTTTKRITTTKKTTTTVKKTTTTTTTTKKKTTTTTTKKTTTTTTTKATTTTKSRYKGIDVSKYQATIDWAKVKKAGIEFVMIRAGYGKEYSQVDPKFKTNVVGAQAAGIDTGVYWYSYATSTSAALQEAKVCYNTIKNYKFSYPIAFDVEEPRQMNLTKTQLSNIVKVFCEYLESKKYYVCVYSFASMLTYNINASVLSNYDIWVAHINTSKPAYSGKYGIWQYSHTGKVNGISGDVDLNYSYQYYPAKIKGWRLNGYT